LADDILSTVSLVVWFAVPVKAQPGRGYPGNLERLMIACGVRRQDSHLETRTPAERISLSLTSADRPALEYVLSVCPHPTISRESIPLHDCAPRGHREAVIREPKWWWRWFLWTISSRRRRRSKVDRGDSSPRRAPARGGGLLRMHCHSRPRCRRRVIWAPIIYSCGDPPGRKIEILRDFAPFGRSKN